MPRKNYKKKSKSLCGMCKDYKTGGDKRWDERELALRQLFEQCQSTGHYADDL